MATSRAPPAMALPPSPTHTFSLRWRPDHLLTRSERRGSASSINVFDLGELSVSVPSARASLNHVTLPYSTYLQVGNETSDPSRLHKPLVAASAFPRSWPTSFLLLSLPRASPSRLFRTEWKLFVPRRGSCGWERIPSRSRIKGRERMKIVGGDRRRRRMRARWRRDGKLVPGGSTVPIYDLRKTNKLCFRSRLSPNPNFSFSL
jgi:hypothetical protein